MDKRSVYDMVKPVMLGAVEDVSGLPAHSVVLCRSGIQPYFRTAWTLSTATGARIWRSSGWRAELTDAELFGGAVEPLIVLYRPLEQFGVGKRRDDGWLDVHGVIQVFGSLPEALDALGSALDTDPNTVLAQRIDPGPWQLHES